MMTLVAAKILSWGNDDTRVSGGHYSDLSGGHMKTMSCSVILTPSVVLRQLSDDALHLGLLRGGRQDRGVAEHAVVKSVLGLKIHQLIIFIQS